MKRTYFTQSAPSLYLLLIAMYLIMHGCACSNASRKESPTGNRGIPKSIISQLEKEIRSIHDSLLYLQGASDLQLQVTSKNIFSKIANHDNMYVFKISKYIDENQDIKLGSYQHGYYTLDTVKQYFERYVHMNNNSNEKIIEKFRYRYDFENARLELGDPWNLKTYELTDFGAGVMALDIEYMEIGGFDQDQPFPGLGIGYLFVENDEDKFDNNIDTIRAVFDKIVKSLSMRHTSRPRSWAISLQPPIPRINPLQINEPNDKGVFFEFTKKFLVNPEYLERDEFGIWYGNDYEFYGVVSSVEEDFSSVKIHIIAGASPKKGTYPEKYELTPLLEDRGREWDLNFYFNPLDQDPNSNMPFAYQENFKKLMVPGRRILFSATESCPYCGSALNGAWFIYAIRAL